MRINVHYSRVVRIITVIVSLIIIIGEIFLITKYIHNNDYKLLFIIIILLILPLVFVLNAPVYILLEPQCFIMKKVLGKVKINYNSILFIDRYSPSLRDVRIFGSGGFWGFIGLFSSEKIGKYYSFVGDSEQCFFIRTISGNSYVFSSEDVDIVIENIKKRINSY